MKPPDIRTTLFMLVACFALALVGLMAYDGWRLADDATRLQHLSRTQAAVEAAHHASTMLARERGFATTLLADPRQVTPAELAELHSYRRAGEEHARRVLTLAGELARDHHGGMLRRLLERHATDRTDLERLRAEVDRELAGTRTGLAQDTWIAAATRHLATLGLIRTTLFVPEQREDRLAFQTLILQEGLNRLCEYAGMERALLGAWIASGQPPSPQQRQEAEHNRLRLEDARDHLQAYLEVMAPDRPVTRLAREARTAYFERLERVRQDVLAAAADGRPYPHSARSWFREATRALDAWVAVSDALAREGPGRLADARQALWVEAAIGVGLLMLLAMGLWLGHRTTRLRIVGPLSALVEAARTIERGELHAPIRARHEDEIGTLAAALERMRVEIEELVRQLAASEHQYRALVEHGLDAIAVIALGRWRYLNPAAVRLLGAPDAEALFDLPITEQLLAPPELLATLAGPPSGPHRGEARVMGPDGALREVELAIVPLVLEGLPGHVLWLRDVTSEREAARLRLGMELLRRADEIKTSFLRTVSHELRTPCTCSGASCTCWPGPRTRRRPRPGVRSWSGPPRR